jgi:hypothetical protein
MTSISGLSGMPEDDDLDIAILWLREYETEPERSAALRVADWLDATKEDRFVRHAARKAGVPVAALRRKLEEQKS